MDYGIALTPTAAAGDIAARAEALGFSHVWFYDTQLLCHDILVAMTAAALKTNTIKLCAGVLVPSNRLAAVAANAMASLNALAPGRVIAGLGTGYTARRTMGLPAQKMSDIREYARVMRALGAPVLFVSNAAGGIRRTFTSGTLMQIDDHINLMNRHALAGPSQPGEPRFPDMSAPYDKALAAQLHTVARRSGVRLEVGVYCGLLGPTYETPAEVRMLEKLGADAVGMSTVPEVITARTLGMRCVGVSLITNAAAGYTATLLDHAEVLHESKEAATRFQSLITAFVATL